MAISRRGLFGFLASVPVMAPAIVREAAAAPTIAPLTVDRLTVDPLTIDLQREWGRGFNANLNLNAGAINWVDADYDERTGEVRLYRQSKSS